MARNPGRWAEFADLSPSVRPMLTRLRAPGSPSSEAKWVRPLGASFEWETSRFARFRRQAGLCRFEEGDMTARWWIYVVAFLLSLTLVVIGLSQANTPLTFAGVIMGAALFFARKYIQ